MAKEFLLEIGTEELPASFLTFGLKKLKDIFLDFFNENQLKFDNISTYGTPRRLTLLVENLSEKQDDIVLEKTGPSKRVAIDENGNFTKAAIGFAKSQGVNVEDLKIVTTEKGEYVAIKKVVKGRDSFSLLQENLPGLLKKLVFPKNMRWGNEDISFARPIHWILSILNGEVIEFKYGSIISGNTSYGHRFLAPESFTVNNFNEYYKELKNRYVIVDFEKRKKEVLTQVKDIAKSLDGIIEEDEELLETVTNLVEYPFAVYGKIEEEFLELPKEVIITSMKVHQKYFPVYDNDKKLEPYFITVSNTKAKDMSIVAKGNERVLKARLNDAKFFYEEDRKYKLEHFVERLRKVVFQRDIGTSYEKMERFKDLAIYLSDNLNPEIKDIVNRAAYLCKGDLETNMVYEFPELQGIMGKYYALHSGEKKAVADAIFEHYLPRFAGDELPKSDAGAFISIADRIDTICGFFAIGKIPTGTADPYALRRHSIAIINIIIGKKYRFSLKELLNRAAELYTDKVKVTRETIGKVLDFFAQRFLNIFNEKFSYNSIESVLSIDFDDIYETYLRLQAIENIKQDKDFQDIVIPFKRVANITKDWENTQINVKLFAQKEEKELYTKFQEVAEEFKAYKNREAYVNALKTFTKLKDSINNFFDNVLVMDKNEEIKTNRLNLLKNIFNTFNSIGDLTKL